MRRGPHWLLNDPDAKAYGTALSNALRHLPITAAQKTIDFAALGIAVMVYEGPRVAMDVQLQRQAQAQRQQQRAAAPVFAFAPPPSAAPNAATARPGPTTPQSATPAAPAPEQPMTYEPEFDAAA